jgi:hypothetical protein
MSCVSIEQIVTTYPGIADDPDMDVYIELAKTQTGAAFYGDRYSEAVALRAAHNLVMSKPLDYASFMSGGIASKRQGGITVDYNRSASESVDKSGLSQTTFGKQLIALMRMSNTTMGVVGAVS